MLHSNNALAEKFSEHLAPFEIPISDINTIQSALHETSEANRRYRDDETMTAHVPESWHQGLVLDFFSWLSAHIPETDEEVICRRYYDEAITKQYVRYRAHEIIDSYEPIITSVSPETLNAIEEEIVNVVNTLCSMAGTKTIVAIDPSANPETLFMPDYTPALEHLDSLHAFMLANPNSETVAMCECQTALSYIVANVILQGQGSIAAISHLPNGDSEVVVLSIYGGKALVVAPQAFQAIEKIPGNDDMTIAEMNLDEHLARSEFEYEATNMGALIASACMCASKEAESYARDYAQRNELTGNFTFNIRVADSAAAISSSNAMRNAALIDIYDDIYAHDEVMFSEKAGAYLTAFALEQAAEEIILTSECPAIAENVSDMFTSMELGMSMVELDKKDIRLLCDYHSNLESMQMMNLTEELYNGLDANDKASVDAIMRHVEENPQQAHVLIAIEGDIRTNEQVNALSTSVPVGAPPQVRSELTKMMRGLVTKMLLSGYGNIFLSTKDVDDPERKAFVSMLNWKQRAWSNADPEVALDILESSSVGDDLGLINGDFVIFREIMPDGTTRDSLGE